MVLPYEFTAKAIVEEGRTTRSAIDEIKDWLQTTALPQLQDEMIVLFLLSCKNVISATKDTIQAYFRIKGEMPEMFNGRDVDEDDLKIAVNTVHCSSIPVRMSGNTVIHFFKLNDSNYQNFDLVTIMKLAFMVIDISQRRNPPADLLVIIDIKGAGFMHLTRFKVGAVRKFLEYVQEGMPLRIRMVHIINSNYLFDKVLALARAFIKNELMALIRAHPPGMDMEQFQKDHVPATCLPKEYDGELPSLEELHQITVDQFRELKPFFEEEERLRGVL